MYKAYGYSNLGKIREEYEQNVAWNIERDRRLKLACFQNCQMRCEKCWNEVEDCQKCTAGLNSMVKNFMDYFALKLTCHICKAELPQDWYFCDVCNTNKTNKQCLRRHQTKISLLCACKLPCCGEICSTCIQGAEPRSECEYCDTLYCQRHFHRSLECRNEECDRKFCPNKTSFLDFCSKECRDFCSKACSCCEKLVLPEDTQRGACNNCLRKHFKKFRYTYCEKCNKFGECKYYRQRNKTSQRLVFLCESCKKDEIRKCSICGCGLILREKEFKIYGKPVKKAYFFFEEGDKVNYVCSRPKCVFKATEHEHKDLKEPL